MHLRPSPEAHAAPRDAASLVYGAQIPADLRRTSEGHGLSGATGEPCVWASGPGATKYEGSKYGETNRVTGSLS